jgi:hypothetical protein
MPIVRIDPPKRGQRSSSRIATGAARGFATGGYLGAILGAAGNVLPTGSSEERASRYTVPVEFDTETGQVRLLSLADGKDAGAKYGRERDQLKFRERASEALPILQEIAATGEYQEGLPKGWTAVGQEIARIAAQNPPTPRDYSIFEGVADKPERAQSGRETSEGDYFMGGFIPPGGMAGFSQMTGASRLALTRGARGRSTGTRRRKRRAKKASPVRRKRKARAAKGRRRKLVKGSAAAKRFMASIRRKRRRA